MLDKGQIKDWEGEPEDPAKPAAVEPRSGIAGAIFDSHEALPTGERVALTPEQTAARKRRGQWLAIAPNPAGGGRSPHASIGRSRHSMLGTAQPSRWLLLIA